MTKRETLDKELTEAIASLLIASSLFHSQISEQGTKTINFKVYEEHLFKEVEILKSTILGKFSLLETELRERVGDMRNLITVYDEGNVLNDKYIENDLIDKVQHIISSIFK